VVMVSVTGVGIWTVAVEPDGVTTVTDDSAAGMVSVVVPPYEVSTWETTGELAIEMTEPEASVIVVGFPALDLIS